MHKAIGSLGPRCQRLQKTGQVSRYVSQRREGVRVRRARSVSQGAFRATEKSSGCQWKEGHSHQEQKGVGGRCTGGN